MSENHSFLNEDGVGPTSPYSAIGEYFGITDDLFEFCEEHGDEIFPPAVRDKLQELRRRAIRAAEQTLVEQKQKAVTCARLSRRLRRS